MSASADYWEQRGRDFAGKGAGLRAVCSYGMPAFYNGYIHLTQHLALKDHLRVAPGTEALDLGCGIGRWSRQLAKRGAKVVGIDLAPSMIEQARARTQRDGLDEQIDYRVGDLRTLELGRRFELVLAVTVLQHILDDLEFTRAVTNVARHLAPKGRAVILDAAPSHANPTCDTHIFRARTTAEYLTAYRNAGLRVVALTGVDPAPFKQKVLPVYRKLSPITARAAMFAATMFSLPYDAILGRSLVDQSWHKVFLLEHNA